MQSIPPKPQSLTLLWTKALWAFHLQNNHLVSPPTVLLSGGLTDRPTILREWPTHRRETQRHYQIPSAHAMTAS